MSTTIKDPEGHLLWQPNDFGLYSNMKTEVIAEILTHLFEDTLIQVETHSGDTPITNVYTKEESDARFFQIALFPSYLDGQIYRLIAEGQIVGINDLNLINSRLLLLYKSCFGTDLDGHLVQTGFDVRIQNLEDTSDFLFNRVTKISRDIYLIRDGEVDINVLVVAKLEDTGYKSDLDPDIGDISNMVAAINAVNHKIESASGDITGIESRVSDLETQAGDSPLDTIAQTLSSAINELKGAVDTNTNNISTNTGNISTNTNDITVNAQNIATNTHDIATNAGNIATNTSDISGLKTGVGNVSNLDSGFTTKEVVSALNQLIDSVNTLSGQISSLDARVSALEGN